MAAQSDIRLVDRDDHGIDRAFRADVLEGLSAPQKAIPARWFYDDEGSRLFEDITRLPEYYLTRAETETLRERASDFARLIGPGRAVVEFGSGSSLKTPLLLDAIQPGAYVPIDIAGDFLRESSAALAAKFPGLPVHPIEADFTTTVKLPPELLAMSKLGFFPGSTIGNMVPRSAVDLLRTMRMTLGGDAMLLIGMDLIKDIGVLTAAYDDAAGVTAAFNRNLLKRINRELDGDIPIAAFAHRARWNNTYARIEMHLEARAEIAFTVAGRSFTMRAGETIHTENSHKFDLRSANTLLLAGHWTPVERWTDSEDRFALILARASVPRKAP